MPNKKNPFICIKLEFQQEKMFLIWQNGSTFQDIPFDFIVSLLRLILNTNCSSEIHLSECQILWEFSHGIFEENLGSLAAQKDKILHGKLIYFLF